MAIYVNDGIIFADRKSEIENLLVQLKSAFDIHEEGNETYLGFQIERSSDKSIYLHQEAYIRKILQKFNMDAATPAPTPVALGKLSLSNEPFLDNEVYRAAVGSLMYAATTTRADIAYAVNRVSRKIENPSIGDWADMKRIFCYLNDKRKLGLRYEGGTGTLTTYCDADFAGDQSAKSTTGLAIKIGGSMIHWKSERQKIVTLSSTEEHDSRTFGLPPSTPAAS